MLEFFVAIGLFLVAVGVFVYAVRSKDQKSLYVHFFDLYLGTGILLAAYLYRPDIASWDGIEILCSVGIIFVIYGYFRVLRILA